MAELENCKCECKFIKMRIWHKGKDLFGQLHCTECKTLWSNVVKSKDGRSLTVPLQERQNENINSEIS